METAAGHKRGSEHAYQSAATILREVWNTGKSAVRLAELQYNLPTELIAQHAVEPRDSSRLLVLDRASGSVTHRVFRDLGDYLNAGDCLVLNDTRVVRARFFCRRVTGGRIEALYLHQQDDAWRVMLKPSARLEIGQRLSCTGADVSLLIVERLERGEWLVRPEPPVSAIEMLDRVGWTPLPPYIRRGSSGHGEPEPGDAQRYQTVYAQRPGAVAAPTAGLHFTDELLERLEARGVRRAQVTLHVGAGTFVPIQADDLAEHRMHAEWFEIGAAAAATISAVKAAGGRVVAVGTTAARVLESLPEPSDDLDAASAWTDIFIYPPYRWRHVDRLLTNFHLPGSTLLALVMALATPELIRKAYQEAIDRRYRFYSYGDAMLIM